MNFEIAFSDWTRQLLAYLRERLERRRGDANPFANALIFDMGASRQKLHFFHSAVRKHPDRDFTIYTEQSTCKQRPSYKV